MVAAVEGAAVDVTSHSADGVTVTSAPPVADAGQTSLAQVPLPLTVKALYGHGTSMMLQCSSIQGMRECGYVRCSLHLQHAQGQAISWLCW